jgi:two-component sensor histidine kinase
MGALSLRVRQQEILADLGVMALQNSSLVELLDTTAQRVAEGLQADYSKVMEYRPEEGRLLVRAGFGWKAGVVGTTSVGADLASPAGFALRTGKPVISNHLENEERFRTPELLVQHGIRRAMNVILQGDGRPFGVLEVDSRSEGEFVEYDLAFLQGAANILGMAIERQRHEASLRKAIERQRLLLREINHRVMNSLSLVASMLSLQARGSGEESVQRHLEEAASRVHTIARAHARLYKGSDLQTLDVSTYIREVCEDLPTTTGHRVVVEAPAGLSLSTDRAIPLALIVVELVTNALKYAYGEQGGIVWVSLVREQEDLVVVVRDHGRGLPSGFAPERSKGLGMRIVLALARQVDAAIVVGTQDNGASFEMRLPLGAAG